MELKEQQQKRGMALMAVCAILWSTAGIFIKWISWNPLIIAGGRSLIAAIVFGIFMAATGRRLKINKYSILTAIGLTGCLICFVTANKLTTAANAIVLQYTAPIFILILSALFLHKKMKRVDVTVVLITAVGIALFFFDQLSPGSILGNIFGIVAGFSLAIMFISAGMAADDDSVRMTGILLAHISLAIIGACTLFFVDFQPTAVEVKYIVILGIFQLGIPYVLYSMASKTCSPLACSLIGTLEPLLNPVWVFLFVGEAPGLWALFGGVIVIFAITTWIALQNRQRLDTSQDTEGPSV